jgi:aryl-alcohol dehydrogenase-like predicted oxidoreductase
VHDLPVVPVPGTRSRARLAENVAAVALSLSPAELAALDAIGPQVAGSPAIGLTFRAATDGRAQP